MKLEAILGALLTRERTLIPLIVHNADSNKAKLIGLLFAAETAVISAVESLTPRNSQPLPRSSSSEIHLASRSIYTMDWHMVAAIFSIACTVLSGINMLLKGEMRQELRSSIADLRLWITDMRDADKKEMREFINGSFIRAPIVETKLSALEQRVGALEAALIRSTQMTAALPHRSE
jgi:hypothetical protein